MGVYNQFTTPLQCASKETLSNKDITFNNELKNIRRYLKKHNLLNNKYLSKRNSIYYYVFYFEKDDNQQFSLRTSDFLIANIMKYKIINSIKEEIRKMGNDKLFDLNQKLTIFGTDNNINVSADSEEEKAIIKDITNKTINSIKKRNLKKVQSNIELKSSRKSKNNIRKHIDLYIDYLKSKNNNEKTIHGYIKKFEVLIDYFNHIKVFSLLDINKKHCRDLQAYLLKFPSNLNKYDELEGKNIFELIDKKDKILDKYQKLGHRTVDNYITRYKTLFNYFLDYDYVYANYFMTIKNLKPKIENPITQFQKIEDIREQFEKEEIELLLEKIEETEIKNLIVLATITGARLNELVKLQVNDILKSGKSTNYFIDIKKSKTYNGVRKIPIHRHYVPFMKKLLENKKDEDFIFFNDVDGKRLDKIQKRTMYQIRKYIKSKNKVFHSFRKNFTQQLYKNNIEELYIKLFLGHTLKDNLSFNTYNLAKVDNQLLQEEMNKVNFKELFEDTDYSPSNIQKLFDENINLKDLINSSSTDYNF